MDDTFRRSMSWLHTWAGVVLGSVLFAMFWMGTLSVFDREIDRWMMPATRLAAPPAPASLDALKPDIEALTAGAKSWGLTLPTPRQPTVSLYWETPDGDYPERHLDPATARTLPDQGTLAGTGFIFPFHFSLHLNWADLGYWLVGAAGMGMLLLLVSGVVIHRKVFAEFFVFRPKKRLQRANLDLHNLSGVLALPFHFVITLSGLLIFMGTYFPDAPQAAFADAPDVGAAYEAEAYGRYRREPDGKPAPLASLDAMLTTAEREWAGGRPYFVRVWHPGDANAYVELRRSYAQDITMNLDQLYFDGASGAVLSRFEAAPVMTVQRFISGLHFIQFEHWALRWMYFALGLSGCVMIATGFVFWLEARRARHARQGLAGVRIVEALTIGSVSGIILATLAFFVANRLLPLESDWLGVKRAHLEMWAFYLVWLATFAHAGRWPARAWSQQCVAIAALGSSAVLLNALTTGDHLLATLARGQWAVAGMDLMLLAGAALALLVARRLSRAPTRDSRRVASPTETQAEHA